MIKFIKYTLLIIFISSILITNVNGGTYSDFMNYKSIIKRDAKNDKHAEKITILMENTAKESEIISRVDAMEVGAMVAKWNINIESLNKIIKLMAQIDLIKEDLSFPDVVGIFGKFIVHSNIKPLNKLMKSIIPDFDIRNGLPPISILEQYS